MEVPGMRRELLEIAREMRRSPTRSEAMLWEAIRNRKLSGVKFRRQHVIDKFIVDFYAPSHRLVVEIDGVVHEFLKEKDRQREEYLRERNLNIVRFTSEEIENALPESLRKLKATFER